MPDSVIFKLDRYLDGKLWLAALGLYNPSNLNYYLFNVAKCNFGKVIHETMLASSLHC